jgi:hypothetical protein
VQRVNRAWRCVVASALASVVVRSGVGTLFAAVVVAGCAAGGAVVPPVGSSHEIPQLRLPPALLGYPLALQQHLTLQAPGHEQQLDVLLEADQTHVRMGVLAMGQVAARLDWDGVTLTEDRAPWWPQAVSGSRILSDLQLTLWPVAAIQAVLPAGWQLAEQGATRTLSENGTAVTVVTRSAAQVVEIDQRREHFHLKIESRDLRSDAQAASAVPDSTAASAASAASAVERR